MSLAILITGTSTGLGLETAIALAHKGHHVYATMRNTKKSDTLLERAKAENLPLTVLPLDVTKTETIQEAVSTLMRKEGRIDVLINNAGGGFAKTTEDFTEEEMQWVTDLNYFGVVRCTKAVLPHMRTQKSGHIINISSVGGLVGQPFNELYCAAKFAVEGYTEAMATYLTEAFGIRFTLVEPGGITSAFLKSAMDKTMTDGQMTREEYMPILQKYLAGVQSRSDSGGQNVYQSAEEVAAILVDLVHNENPPLRMRTSEWSEDFCQLKTQADPDGTLLVKEIKQRFLS